MNYECKCIPTQEYPHIVKSPHVKYYWGVPFFRVYKVLTPAKSCDNHPVPQKKWSVNGFRFGKIIY